jgi:hypothetical protein
MDQALLNIAPGGGLSFHPGQSVGNEYNGERCVYDTVHIIIYANL